MHFNLQQYFPTAFNDYFSFVWMSSIYFCS